MASIETKRDGALKDVGEKKEKHQSAVSEAKQEEDSQAMPSCFN